MHELCSFMAKENLKQKAIELRKIGKTYSEIMQEVPVVKSTISLWLKEIGLSVPQKQRITEKRRVAQRRGADAKRNIRIAKQTDLMTKAYHEIGPLSKRELWLMGIALYWAEGAKEKEERPGSRASFSNSDPRMIAIFIKWLKECAKVPDEDISADLYIHESHKEKVKEIFAKWGSILKQPPSFFRHVYLKKNKINTKRKNTGVLYIGLLRVNIRASSDLNRKIAGWISGITDYWGIV
ncbi:MAG: hypothetical protein AAB629_01785 [Patescibacteria group bacterium]